MSIIGGIILFLFVAAMVAEMFKAGGVFAIIAGIVCVAAVICVIYAILSIF